MMGLDARLKQARIGAVVSVAGDAPVAQRVAELAGARVDLLVLDASGVDREDFLRAFGDLRRVAGTRPITGVLAPADLGAATRADVVIGQVPLPHPHALRIVHGLDAQRTGVDGLIIEAGELSRACTQQPIGEPTSLPWFVATSPSAAPGLMASGARRLWLRDPDPARIADLRQRLSGLWRAEPGGVALGGWGWRRP